MPYKIETFSRDYSFHGFAPIDRPNIAFDYLTLEKTSVTCQNIQAQKGDFAIISDSFGSVIYNGIVSDIDITDDTTLTLQPLLSLFDCDVFFDRTQSNHIETFIAGILEAQFQNSSDSDQNIIGFTVTTTSDTVGSLNLKDNIHNLYDIMVSAISNYAIVVNPVLNIQNKTLTVTIGTVSETATIESDLPAISERSIILGESYGELNKITIVNEDQETQQATYYLTTTGSISTSPTNRILPVFFGYKYTRLSGDDTFSDAAYDAAYDALAKTKYNNLIEITAQKDSKVLPLPQIGLSTSIRHNSTSYQSILTGYSMIGDMQTLIFGCVRADLTKQLIMERRKSND